MNKYCLLFLGLFTLVACTFVSNAQDDEARTASGLPQMIGTRGRCSNAPVGADALISGSLMIEGFPETGKQPALTVSVLANGVVVVKERVKNRSSFGFSCIPRAGIAVVVEADGLEIGRYQLGSLNPPPLSNRQDILLNWLAAGPADRSKNGTISALDAYPRKTENQKILENAIDLRNEKKLESAIKLFKQILEKDTADHVVWTELGNTYFRSDNPTEAETAYLKALELKKDFVPALVNLGKLYLFQKKPAEAIDVLGKAVAVLPESADVNQYLGEAYLMAKKGSLAVGYLNAAIRIAPVEKAEIHLRLAALYNAAGAKDRAATEYKLFLQKVPNYPERKALEKYISENPPKS